MSRSRWRSDAAAVRAREHYERGDQAQATVYGLVALIGLVITLGGITLGLISIAD